MGLAVLDPRRFFAIPRIYDAVQDFIGANEFKRLALSAQIPTDRRLRVLEVGCGPGRNLDYLPENVDYTGCDLSPDYIEHARNRYGQRAQFHCLSVADLGKLNLDKFDIVMAIGVLHHLNDDLVRSLARQTIPVLESDGFFLAVEPCWTARQSWMNRKIMSFDRGEDIRKIEGYVGLLKESFGNVEGRESDTKMIVYPTSACVIRAKAAAA
jgi:SAM-dependent methyltransferase